MERLLIFIAEHPTEFIAIITAVIAILSNVISIIDYFRKKGYYDYFLINEKCRNYKKNIFNPEYFMTSLFIVSMFSLALLSNGIKECINSALCSIFYLTIIIIIKIISYIIFYLFSKEDIQKKIFLEDELNSYVEEKSLLTTIKYSILILIFYSIYQLLPYMLLLVFILTIGVVIEIAYEYCVAKIRTQRNREFDIIFIKSQKYCILAKINENQYYAVEMYDNKDSVKLILDKWIIVPINDNKITTRIYNKHDRIFNNENIVQKKYIFFDDKK